MLINPCSLFKSIAFVLSTQILIEKIEVNKFKSTGKDLKGFCLLFPLESSDHIQFITLYVVAEIPSTKFSHPSSLSHVIDMSNNSFLGKICTWVPTKPMESAQIL